MKLVEIANKINAHLKRFESDPHINKMNPDSRTRPYYYAGAWAAGSRLGIKYISYQGDSFIRKSEAEEYLAWLDAGNVGKYWTMKRPAKQTP